MSDAQTVLIAVELWLLWVQPWGAEAIASSGRGTALSGDLLTNCAHVASAGVVSSRPKTQFDARWTPYVASNLHMYTTLLAAYFR